IERQPCGSPAFTTLNSRRDIGRARIRGYPVFPRPVVRMPCANPNELHTSGMQQIVLLQPQPSRSVRPAEGLQPVFNALLTSDASLEATLPLELCFCLPSRTGPCVLTVSLKVSAERKPAYVQPAKGGLAPRQLRLVLEYINENL